MKPIVSISKCNTYDRGLIKSSIVNCLQLIGGIDKYLTKGSKVLLKPNLVVSSPKEKALTTHPEIIRAVGELFSDYGVDLYLGDSPGLGSAKKVATACGIYEVTKYLGIKIIEFTPRKEKISINDTKLGILDMAKEIQEMDFCVNLPKYKTHILSTLSLAVKNCFGTIVGTKKFQWHYRAGHSEELFSKMLLDVCFNFNPVINIIDAVEGMEGNGPTSGEKRSFGFIAASNSALALDKVCAEIAGLTPNDVGVLKQAKTLDLQEDWEHPKIKGVGIDEVLINNLKLPATKPYDNMLPLFFKNIIRKLITSSPKAINEICTGCAICKNICPAQAIKMLNNIPQIDYSKCIRCYCCHELCPQDAMGISKNLMGRVTNLFNH